MQISKEMLEDDDWGLIEATFDSLTTKLPKLSEAQKPVVYLVTAQGIIENGGLRYFLESDFPHGVSHAEVAACFRNIGMTKAHEIILSSLEIFPDFKPQADLAMRSELLESDNSAASLGRLDAQIFSEMASFEKILANYIRSNLDQLYQSN